MYEENDVQIVIGTDNYYRSVLLFISVCLVWLAVSFVSLFKVNVTMVGN